MVCLKNPSEGAIHLLEKNQDKIYWKWLSGNPSAIHMLKKYPNRIYWKNFLKNPHVFNYDYKKMKDNCMLFKTVPNEKSISSSQCIQVYRLGS